MQITWTCSCTASPAKGAHDRQVEICGVAACHVRKAIAYEAHAHRIGSGARAAGEARGRGIKCRARVRRRRGEESKMEV